MTIYIALIRGINVGGHNLIKMQDLRNSLKSIGLGHVQTYIQSGNIVFQSEDKPEKLKLQIEQVIKSEFGFLVPVILRSSTEWEEIIKNCPYAVNSLSEGESIHLALLETEPTKACIQTLLTFKSKTEECYINGKEIYVYLQGSFHRAKLPIQIQKIGVSATVRNWKTIKKLEAMVNALK